MALSIDLQFSKDRQTYINHLQHQMSRNYTNVQKAELQDLEGLKEGLTLSRPLLGPGREGGERV